jgi:hypothetical protein
MPVRWTLGALLGSALLQCGCGGCGPPEACRTYEADFVSASSGNSDVSVAEGDGGLRSQQIVAEYDPDAPGTCAATLGVSAGGACFETGEDEPETTGVGFGCTLNDELGIFIDSSVGDLRLRGVGTYELEDVVPPALIPTDPNASVYRPTGSTDCVQLVVEEAVGGPLPYPDVVTEDYLRVARVEYDCDFAFDGSSVGSVRVVGQVTFTVTADNYHTRTITHREC